MDITDPGLRFARSPEQLSCELDDEIAILDLGSKRYFGVTGAAATIWRELETLKSLEQITTAVVDEYHVEAGRCRQDVVAFLGDMHQRGLLAVNVGQTV